MRKNALREREIDNARRRVRNAAEKAEQTLRHIVNHDALWDWTDPDRAIREMRARHFGDEFAKLPMTDIEEALNQKGNVLFIIAVYPRAEATSCGTSARTFRALRSCSTRKRRAS